MSCRSWCWWSGLALVVLAAACGADDSSDPTGVAAPGERGPIGKADMVGSCAAQVGDHCGGPSTGNCWCDAECEAIGDCCDDVTDACGELCTARFTWLQKDAYLETAGRNYPFFPAHTTTTLTVVCGDETVAEAAMSNHGTAVGAVDANGTPILAEVRAAEHAGRRNELASLVDAFESCECGTTFLSLDELEGSLVDDVIGELAAFVSANLSCPADPGTAALVAALTAGDIEYVLQEAEACTWAAGSSWEEGFNAAVADVAERAGLTLTDYHVCNNDAALQAQLWDGFVESAQAGACEPQAEACRGPLWFYEP